ncbi:transmembrane proteins 14C-domain-containing protein [Limtongia smithiae]|uniref:transmembrane proteins 14C-domain-containing protein n=1 Tax=Limtongia smithiae TaxID=1125753 RepID=UPI0034CEE6E0
MEHPAFTLAALCSFGGVMGYMRKGSLPSLMGGLGVGALYGVGGYLLKQNMDYGIQVSLGASLLLTFAGAPRAIKLRKPLPIALTTIGLVTSAYYAKKYSEFYLE